MTANGDGAGLNACPFFERGKYLGYLGRGIWQVYNPNLQTITFGSNVFCIFRKSTP